MAAANPYLAVRAAPIDEPSGTVGQFLKDCLISLWEEGEGFSGKRPLGNSDWQFVLIDAVIDSGLAKNDDEAHELIAKTIQTFS